MLPAPPDAVYRALMTSKEHADFTQAAAKISAKVGGKFTAYDGYISGKNLELAPGKKIVQSWASSDFLKGQESEVSFLLSPHKNGTRLEFTHSNVPEGQYESLKKGWTDFYWKPMKEYFSSL